MMSKVRVFRVEWPNSKNNEPEKTWMAFEKKYPWSRWKLKRNDKGGLNFYLSREAAVKNEFARISVFNLGSFECFDDMKLFYIEYRDPADGKWRIRDWENMSELLPRFYKTEEEARKNLLWRSEDEGQSG